MTIKTRVTKDGRKALWLSLSFRNRKTNAREQYRRDAQVQTRAGADREERDVVAFWVEHGTIIPLLSKPRANSEGAEDAHKVNTWADAVALYTKTYALTLKPSTRESYKEILESKWFKSWAGLDVKVLSQDATLLAAWDGELAKTCGDSRRRNIHVTMRTVFRVAEDAGWHPGLVKFRTGQGRKGVSLPRVGEKSVHATHPEDVEALMNESDEGIPPHWADARRASRLALALCAFAGLRASEVRALKWKHVDLRRGEIHVCEALCAGEVSTTKSGHQRTLPIPGKLLSMLKARKLPATKPDDHVAPSVRGTPWSDKALYHCLIRAVARLGLDRTRVHALRHYFVTTMFKHGKSARVVQKLAGHSTLNVTQRYADATSEAMADAVSVFDLPVKPVLKVIDGGKSSTG